VNDPTVKGILKASGTYTKNYDLDLKTAKFDEVNIMNTFHPVGKDYGHMIIDEPKTPWVCEDDLPKELDTNVLIEKLRMTSKTEMPAFGIDGDSEDSSADEDYPESLEEKVRRTEFERRRKLHYKEFFSVPLARRLISEEFSEWTSESSSHSHQGEESMPCSEVCPESELGILDAHTPPSSFANTPSTGHGDLTPQPDVEPGFDPSHPCYHKLVAEIDLDNRMESLSHLHTIPS
ncbi:hypothetical protein KR026_004210, partial [Drosophila bipectinata]